MSKSGGAYIDWDGIYTVESQMENFYTKDADLDLVTNPHDYYSSLSADHNNFLGTIVDVFDPNANNDGIGSALKTLNLRYNNFVDQLNAAYERRNVDEDGGVAYTPSGSYGGGSGYSADTGAGAGAGAGDSSFTSGVGTPAIEKLDTATPISESISTGDVSLRKDVPETVGGSAALGDAASATGSNPIASPGALAVGAGTLGGAAALSAALGDVGGLGGAETAGALNPVNYVMGNFAVSENFSEAFTDDEKASITSILEENGYSKEEIEAILNGGYDTSQVLMDNMSETLNEVIKNNPELRNEIIEKYGFDIFNEDGSVNQDKLSMALYIDDMSGKDNYSMISLLSEHGVHLVDQNMLNNYTKEFENLVLNDYSIKGKIVDRYGFDIFNEDGTINKDRLTLAMLVDAKRKDGVSLASIINDSVSSDITGSIGTNIRNIGGTTTSKKGSFDALPLASVLAASGAAAGIGVTTHLVKKKKKEENAEEVEVEDKKQVEEKMDQKQENDTGWMKDIINEQ